jgi:hypothetical protein
MTTLVTLGRAGAARSDALVVESAGCAPNVPRAGQRPGLSPEGVKELGRGPSLLERALP